MYTENTENNERPPMPPNYRPQREPQLAAEVAQVKESAERANAQVASDLERLETRQHIDEEKHELGMKSHRKSDRGHWAALMIVAAALIGAAWYGSPILQSHSQLLAKLPSFEDSIGSMGHRVDSAEEQLRSWAGDQAGMVKRFVGFEKRVTADLQLARQESREMVSEVRQRFENETEPMRARMTQFESGQDAAQARLDEVRNEFRQEIGEIRRETAQEMAAMRQDNSRGFSNMNRQSDLTKRDLDGLSQRVSFDRVDFEASKNRNTELAPGISLKLTKTNVDNQRVDGYVQLVPDGHTLWVRGQGIEQPVVFFSQKDNRARELVFTRVSKDDVVGYLLVPVPVPDRGSPSSASAAGESNKQLSYSAPPVQ